MTMQICDVTCGVHGEAVDGVLVPVEGGGGHRVVARCQRRQRRHIPQEYCLPLYV
jgi:hypothetical protein